MRPEQIGLVIYRSTSNKTTIRDIIDNGLTRHEHGLKFSTKHTDINTILQLLITGQIPVELTTSLQYLTQNTPNYRGRPKTFDGQTTN